jgi:hypothetical protein
MTRPDVIDRLLGERVERGTDPEASAGGFFGQRRAARLERIRLAVAPGIVSRPDQVRHHRGQRDEDEKESHAQPADQPLQELHGVPLAAGL